jgi:uncharacterized protein YdhG (YjbR/CyaY superfamily)
VTAPATVDEYIASAPEQMRGGLEAMRKAIRAAAPKADEGISYGVPTYKYLGMLCSFGAAKNHVSFYGASTELLGDRDGELAKYDTAKTKGTIRFSPDERIPVDLIKKLVKVRLTENEEKERRRKEKKAHARTE